VREIRFYTDEQVSKAVIRGLRDRGVDVLTTPEANNLHATDIDHLRFAWSEQRVLFTQDDDFLKLAASGAEHAGIIYAPQSIPIGQIVRGLILIYEVLDSDDMKGHVEYL